MGVDSRKPPEPRPHMGVKGFHPTPEQRRTVETLAAYGTPHVEIGWALQIDAKTLRKHFRDELDHAKGRASAKVAETLFRLAIGTEERAPNVGACIFWLKAQAGWSEKHELTGAGGADLVPAAMTIKFVKPKAK